MKKTKVVRIIFGNRDDDDAKFAFRARQRDLEEDIRTNEYRLASFKRAVKNAERRLAVWKRYIEKWGEYASKTAHKIRNEFAVALALHERNVMLVEMRLARLKRQQRPFTPLNCGAGIKYVTRAYKNPARGALNRQAIAEQMEVVGLEKDIDDEMWLQMEMDDLEAEENYICYRFQMEEAECWAERADEAYHDWLWREGLED